MEEQYSILLRVLCGYSLKEDNSLWEAFRNLRRARNSFVHEGRAKIRKEEYLQPSEALYLIDKASQIIGTIREWLPEKHRWPVYQHTTWKFKYGKVIAIAKAATNNADTSSSSPDVDPV